MPCNKIRPLETPQQHGDFGQKLAAYQQDITELREAVEQIQADSQQMGEKIQQIMWTIH
jgi:phage shock protein A